jgi:hypothetical protein
VITSDDKHKVPSNGTGKQLLNGSDASRQRSRLHSVHFISTTDLVEENSTRFLARIPQTIPLMRWLQMTGGVIHIQRPPYRLMRIITAAHPNFLGDISVVQRHGIILFVNKTVVTDLEVSL